MKPTLYALAGAFAAVLITTTSALAGSGAGGVFNLGQVNTVNAQSSLTGNPGGNPELKVTSTGTAAAVRGEAGAGIGTNGVSTSGVGQQGLSNSGIGTLGTHGNTTGVSPGVQGETNSTDPAGAGVVGRNNGGGPGLKAIVSTGAPPLAVNSPVKVANLNADLLDGIDSGDFLPKTGVATDSSKLGGLPPSSYLPASALGRLGPITIAAANPASSKTIGIIGPYTFTGSCYFDGTSIESHLDVTPSVDHAMITGASIDTTSGHQYVVLDMTHGFGAPIPTASEVTGIAVTLGGQQMLFNVYGFQGAQGHDTNFECTFGGMFVM